MSFIKTLAKRSINSYNFLNILIFPWRSLRETVVKIKIGNKKTRTDFWTVDFVPQKDLHQKIAL